MTVFLLVTLLVIASRDVAYATITRRVVTSRRLSYLIQTLCETDGSRIWEKQTETQKYQSTPNKTQQGKKNRKREKINNNNYNTDPENLRA